MSMDTNGHHWNPGKCGQACGDARHAELESARSDVQTWDQRIDDVQAQIDALQRMKTSMQAQRYAADTHYEKLSEQDRELNAARYGAMWAP